MGASSLEAVCCGFSLSVLNLVLSNKSHRKGRRDERVKTKMRNALCFGVVLYMRAGRPKTRNGGGCSSYRKIASVFPDGMACI